MKLKIIKAKGVTYARHKIVEVRCYCGELFTAFDHNIRSGNTRSCGRHGNRSYITAWESKRTDKSYWIWLDK